MEQLKTNQNTNQNILDSQAQKQTYGVQDNETSTGLQKKQSSTINKQTTDQEAQPGLNKRLSSGLGLEKEYQPLPDYDLPPQLDKNQSSNIIGTFTKLKQQLESQEQMKQLQEKKDIPKAKVKHKKEKGKEAYEKLRDMDDHKIPLEMLLEDLGLEDFSQGLTFQQVKERLLRDGDNAITEKPRTPWYVLLFKQLTGFSSLLLWTGCVLCFIGYGLSPSDPTNLYLGVVIAIIVLGTGIFSFYQESKSSSDVASFKNFVPPQAIVIREGRMIQLPTSKIVLGDVVEIRPGDRIPADIRVIEARYMKVDNSSLTGENLALKRSHMQTSENPLETENLAFFGTLCKEGYCRGIVINIGDNTVIGQIANKAQSTHSEETPLHREINRFIKMISAVAISYGIVFFVLSFIYGYPIITCLTFAIAIIVANVPQGLIATVAVSLTLTAQRMAKKQVLVKNLESVETLGSTTCICSEKTGILTQNTMSVSSMWYDKKNPIRAVTKEDLKQNEKAEYDEENPTFQMLQVIAVVNNKGEFDYSIPAEKGLTEKDKARLHYDNQKIQQEEAKRAQQYEQEEKSKKWKERKVNSDASENALVKFFQPIQDVLEMRRKYPKALNTEGQPAAIPFSSSHKYALTIIEDKFRPYDYLFLLKGIPEKVWSFCTKALANKKEMPKDISWEEDFKSTNLYLGRRGERAQGFAYMYQPKSKFQELDMDQIKLEIEACRYEFIFTGLISFVDPPRQGVPEAVALCRSIGIKVIMITGDQPGTAELIAKDVGILTGKTNFDVLAEKGIDITKINDPVERERLEDQAIEEAECVIIHGDKLAKECGKDENKPEEERGKALESWLLKKECSFARTTPAQKLIIVEGCQKLKHIVAVTSDVVNDSPAIEKADIGIAMGKIGSDFAKDAADMLLLNDDFTSIVAGIEEGRLIFDNLKKSIAYTLASNVPELFPFIIFIICQIPLPFTTILILCVDITNMWPAISLAYEPSELDIMQRKPRNAATDHLVNIRLIYMQIGIFQACAGFYTYFLVMNDYGFYPSTLFFMVKEKGIKPHHTDLYDPLDRFKGNSIAWEKFNEDPLNFDSKQDTVDFITDSDNKYDLRIWYLNRADEEWSQCRVHRDSYVSGHAICYTTEALRHAQSAFFVSIVVVQVSCLLVAKTRKLSLFQQGMKNNMANLGIIFEIVLAAFICYQPQIAVRLGTRDLQFEHFCLPAFPFFIFILIYDEVRKMLIRRHRTKHDNKPGWIEKNTSW